MSYRYSDRSHRHPGKVRKALKALLGETGVEAGTLVERRSVINGVTRVDKEILGETRSVKSEDREVAKFTLQEFLVEDELINYIMQMPENDRRRQQRITDWKSSKKPCPAECEEGRIQVMDGWIRCETCHGRGWVI